MLLLGVLLNGVGEHSQSAGAYPPATATTTPDEWGAYPPPATPTQHPPSGDPLNHNLYFPFISNYLPRFSVARSTQGDYTDVVPANLLEDYYTWNPPPLSNKPETRFRMVRSCSALREHSGGTTQLDYFPDFRVGTICWDPVTQQIATILNHPECPYFNDPGDPKLCLDVEESGIVNIGESELRQEVQDRPNVLWLIGNEPDLGEQDALDRDRDIINHTDGSIAYTYTGSADIYARFYAQMYDIIQTELDTIPDDPPPARLAFCQAHRTDEDPDGERGLTYCKSAYEQLDEEFALLDPVSPIDYSQLAPADTIFALSAHQYINCEDIDLDNDNISERICGGLLFDGEIQPFIDDEDPRTMLQVSTDFWIGYLKEFECWAGSVSACNDLGLDPATESHPELASKPLWLTEFGSLSAWCFEAHESRGLRPGIDQVGGQWCKGVGQFVQGNADDPLAPLARAYPPTSFDLQNGQDNTITLTFHATHNGNNSVPTTFWLHGRHDGDTDDQMWLCNTTPNPDCTVTYTIRPPWNAENEFIADVSITNLTGVRVRAWSVSWVFPDGQLFSDRQHVFYGRNNREGIWGMQWRQVGYLSQTSNRWDTAWWYVAETTDTVDEPEGEFGACRITVWLWEYQEREGTVRHCEQPRKWDLVVSRAGLSYHQTLDCRVNRNNCPVVVSEVDPHPTPTPAIKPFDPKATPQPPTCKRTPEHNCTHYTVPLSIPIPTIPTP